MHAFRPLVQVASYNTSLNEAVANFSVIQRSVDQLVGLVIPEMLDLLRVRERVFTEEYTALRSVRESEEAAKQAVRTICFLLFFFCLFVSFFFFFHFSLDSQQHYATTAPPRSLKKHASPTSWSSRERN